MNKKDLLILIKEKANEVEIKDLSASIIEKAKRLPQHEAIEKKPRFSLKPAFLTSALTFALLLVMFLIITPNEPTIYAFENIDQAIVDASIAGLGILSETTDLSQDGLYMLSLSELEAENQATTEIDQLVKYLSATERLLGAGTYQKQINHEDFDVVLDFESTDLLNVMHTYQVRYNLEADEDDPNQLTLTGEIVFDNETYPITGEVIKSKTSQFTLHLASDLNESLEMNYLDDSMKAFRISYYQDEVKASVIELRKTNINDIPGIMIDFIEGTAQGSYAFQMANINDVQKLRATYLIFGDEQEDGEIIFDLTEDNYQIEIIPRGQPSTIIEKGRPTTPPRPPRGGGNRDF